MSNRLTKQASPYLRQHQHNPVDWYPWGEEALKKARDENKLIIVSIGYSACHWCHVMERESFENEAIAAVMNKYFVSIKVDREERPDIDQIYMLAVQLMTNAGGWPLNCICLPDARPIYGGTYFRPDDWQQILLQLVDMWNNKPEVAFDYAERLTSGIQRAELLPIVPLPERYTRSQLADIIGPWVKQFDKRNGGYTRAPKFPLPNNWIFLLRYGALANDPDIIDHVHLTLHKMACGGIYDHTGGGFSRYSVDHHWHIPHFEKMLYDNAQLVSLYAEAYQQRPTPLYKEVVFETLGWVGREMVSPEGGFYCALDADSEGIEGKFYTFQREELVSVLGADAEWFIDYFQVTEAGNWTEEETNVLHCAVDSQARAGISAEASDRLRDAKRRLLAYRDKRVRPGLDDKILTGWNAMMLKGYVDAYRVFGEKSFLATALRAGTFIKQHLYADSGGLKHQFDRHGSVIGGFLDDYAFCVEAFIALYEATFDEQWLNEARQLANYAVANFHDEDTGMFFYTGATAEALIARKHEIMDNVIPSSNSAFVRQLFRLGLLFDQPEYTELANQALANVVDQIKAYGSAYSNWAIQLLDAIFGCYELVLTGPESQALRVAVDQHYVPNKLIAGGTEETLPILKGRVSGQTQAFVCKDNTCSAPVVSVDELLQLIT